MKCKIHLQILKIAKRRLWNTNVKIWKKSGIFSTKIDKKYPLLKDEFRDIWKLISKIPLKVIKMKKLGDAHQNFFKFQRKSPSFQKQMSKKNTFCNMRFKEIHWLSILKGRVFHEDSIAKDFVWIAPLVFEKIPFYLCTYGT